MNANKSVNMTAMSVTTTSCGLRVRLVVGEPHITDKCVNCNQEKNLEKNLQKLNICFEKSKVLQVMNNSLTGVPGVMRVNNAVLTCNNIEFSNFYVGETFDLNCNTYISFIYDITNCNIDRAICLLENLDIGDCEEGLCINRFNINKLVRKYNC